MPMNQPSTSQKVMRARLIREARGETQLQVALATGQHPSVISRMERGKRPPGRDALLAIARYYQVHPDRLLEEVGQGE